MKDPIHQNLENKIYLLRGQKVMLSTDLAQLYQVEPKALIQATKRNIDRFPSDFMFQLSKEEMDFLRSQFVTLESGRGKHPKYALFAFTQEGIAMLSGILRSPIAIQANIAIMRTFVRLRQLMVEHRDLADKINVLEQRYDAKFKVIFNSIRKLIESNPRDIPITRKRTIGF